MIMNRSEIVPIRDYFYKRLRRIVILFNETGYKNRPKKSNCSRFTYYQTASQ